MFKRQLNFDTNISRLINCLYTSNIHGSFVEAYVAQVSDINYRVWGYKWKNTQHRAIIDRHSKCSPVVLLTVVYWQLARNASYLVLAVTFIN
jgi:hypothetical protein